MLQLVQEAFDQMVAHCYDGLPLEACGFLAGSEQAGPGGAGPSTRVTVCYPLDNAAASSRVYTVDPRQHLRADRDAEERGLAIVAVFHSHTHTDAFPSPTDVAEAPDPGWHYVLVSLRDVVPVVRSYRIVDGLIEEEPVVLE